ncbi:MAG TPA: PH domain-containing protein [Acidimicrobiales bacterium]|nr:PH domain-containing protein [Acidimicrobiales bacterium]
MPFPQRLLNEGEEVVLDVQPHWRVLVAPTAAIIVTVALAVMVELAGLSDYVLLAALALTAVAAFVFVVRWLRRRTTNFVLTTDRLVVRSGVIAKRGKEIPLERINDITFHQSVFERLIGAGDLMIESGGEHGQEVFAGLPRPAVVQNAVYRELEHYRDREADRAAGRRGLSVPEQLEKLDELRQRGVISQAEFDAEKTKLLDRL